MELEAAEERHNPQDDHSLARAAKDVFAGAVGGTAQVLLGQPFDIVRVRLQTGTQYSSAIAAASDIAKNEGLSAFYKGTLTPLVGIGACVAVQFGAFHYARRYFEERNSRGSILGTATPLSYSQYYLAGAFAGLSNSVLSGPIEHVRIRLQTQPHGPKRLYSGPVECVKKLVSQSGGGVGGIGNGLFRGQSVTVLREIQAYGVWFLTFEYLMNAHATRKGIDRSGVPTPMVALYGGLAGEALWLSSYPFDVVKSKMQTDGFGAERKYLNMRDCFVKTWKGEGLGGFWRGIGPTLLRAMPVSAGTFAVVEMTMRLLG